MYKILIVDDHPILADGLKTLLSDYKLCVKPDIAVSGKECLSKLNSSEYDIALLDINLPDISGIDLCEKIHSTWPDMKIMALTSYSEFTCIDTMMANGASGYVLKNAMPIFLCHEVDMLMKKETDLHVYLTRREKDMLRLITEGFTNQEISEKLFLGSETVKSYRKNLLFKLNAKNTATLVKIALEQKLV
jgi:DNA-binding NarL/FixJ family response regulator